MGQLAEKKKKKDRKSNRTKQKNKRGESKVESNDSPEVPDKGETSDIPSLPLGSHGQTNGRTERQAESNTYSPITLLQGCMIT